MPKAVRNADDRIVAIEVLGREIPLVQLGPLGLERIGEGLDRLVGRVALVHAALGVAHPIRDSVLRAAHALERLVNVVRPAGHSIDPVHVGPLGSKDVGRRGAPGVRHHLDVGLRPDAGRRIALDLQHHAVGPGVHRESAAGSGILVALAPGGPERSRSAHVPVHHVHSALLGLGVHRTHRISCRIQHVQQQSVLAEGLQAVAIEMAAHPGSPPLVVPRPIAVRRKALPSRPAPLGHDARVGGEHRARSTPEVVVSSTGHPSADHFKAIHDVHAPAERAEHQIRLPLLQDDVPNRNGGHALLPALPFRATVVAPPQSLLGTAPDEVGHLRVLQHALDMAQYVISIDDALPFGAPIAGAIEVGRPIVAAVVVGRHVDLIGVVGRNPHLRNPAALRQALEPPGQRLPRLPAIDGPVQLAVVRGRPDLLLPLRVGRDAEQRRVVLRVGRIGREAAALRLLLLLRIVGRQIRRKDRPRLAAVRTVVDELAAEVDAVRVMGIHGDGRVPVVPELHRVGVVGLDVGHGARRNVQAVDVAPLRHRIGHVGVARHRHNIESVAEADLLPILVADPVAMPHVGRRLPRPVVLQAAVDIVGNVVVDVDVVELADRQVVDEAPRLAAVPADVDAAVVSVEDEIRIVRILVPRVVVRVRPAVGQDHLEGPSPIGALADHAVEVEQAVRVLRIGMDLGIIEGPVADVLGGDKVPIQAPVGGLVQTGLLGLDERVDNVRVRGAHRQAHAAELAARQALVLAELIPVVAAVVRDVQAAAFSTGGEEPGLPVEGPHRREQLVGVARIHDHLRAPRGVVNGQHVVPRGPAIAGAEHAALGVRAPGRSHRGHVHRLRVRRVDADAVDGPRVLEAHHGPGGTPIERAVDAAAGGVAVARVALSRARPDDVGVGRGHRHGSDAEDVLLIEKRFPRRAAGGAAPKSTAGRARIHDVAVGRVHRQGRHPAAHGAGPDVPDGMVLKHALAVDIQAEEEGQNEKQERSPEGVQLGHPGQDTAWQGRSARSGARLCPME